MELNNVKQTKADKVGAKRMFLWQSREISMAANMLVIGFLSIYCTDTLKMPAALVGVLLMGSKIFDGITDLIAGYIVDKTNTRWGRGRPYEWCVVGVWLCTVLMFSCPPEWALAVKGAWILCMYSFVNAIFTTFLNASKTVYMVRAFKGQDQYVAIQSYGSIIVMLFAVAVNVSFPMLMANLTTSPAGWRTLILIYAAPMVLIGMLRFFTIKETHSTDVSASESLHVKDMLLALRGNPYIYIVALMTLVFNLVTNMGVLQYYFTYIVKDVSLMGILALAQVIVLPVVFAFPPIIKKFSITRLIVSGLLLTCCGYLINFFAVGNFPVLMLANILIGAGNVPISMMTALMIIDCAEYNEWKGKPRLEGTLSSVNGFAAKVGAAFGSGVIGVLLTIAGYTGAIETMPDSAITMIRLLYSLVPLGLYVAVMLVLRLYKLDKLMPGIRKDNEQRRAEVQGAEQA